MFHGTNGSAGTYGNSCVQWCSIIMDCGAECCKLLRNEINRSIRMRSWQNKDRDSFGNDVYRSSAGLLLKSLCDLAGWKQHGMSGQNKQLCFYCSACGCAY